MTEIAIQNPRRYRSLGSAHLHDWLRELVEELAPDAASFGVRLVDDKEMRRLNSAYRDRDASTDVLSFPGWDTRDGRHLGDVVISIPTARRQAAEDGVSERRQVKRLLLHGVLHCLGYDHETDDGQMEALEARMRDEWIDDVD